MKIILLFVFLAIGGTSAARMRRITGGQPVQVEYAPFYVSIRRDYRHTCGGALITKNHVLTAEQCVADEQGKTYSGISVVFAMNLQQGDTVGRNVFIIRPPPCVAGAWKREMSVALLGLFESIPSNPNVARIPMSLIDWMGGRVENHPMLRTGTLVGLRHRMAPPFDRPLEILETTVQRCHLPNRLCGIIPHGAMIDGDEGSPLIYNGKIIGIALGHISEIYPLGIFVDVYRYHEFFINTLR